MLALVAVAIVTLFVLGARPAGALEHEVSEPRLILPGDRAVRRWR